MSTSEIFLVAMGIIFLAPYLAWRLGRTEYYAPLVVVQILAGILLGPGILGALLPHYYAFVFNPAVVQSLNGIAWWAVMSFVWIAGIELDLQGVWVHRRESSITAGLALGTAAGVLSLTVTPVPVTFAVATVTGVLPDGSDVFCVPLASAERSIHACNV